MARRGPIAISRHSEAAEHLKRKHPHSTVTVENLETGETTAVGYKP
jgi:hypothetical protein